MLPALAILSLCGFLVSHLIINGNHFDLYSGVLVVIVANKKGAGWPQGGSVFTGLCFLINTFPN
jgi:hypothetical protein